MINPITNALLIAYTLIRKASIVWFVAVLYTLVEYTLCNPNPCNPPLRKHQETTAKYNAYIHF